MTKNPSIYDRLCSEMYYTDLLVRVSHDISNNYLYFDLNDATPVILFDFDIVYASLLSRLPGIRNPSARFGSAYDLFSVLPSVGPTYLRDLLTNIQSYTLPPGAQAELFRHAKLILGNVDQRYESLASTIAAARNADDPVGSILKGDQSPKDLIGFLEDKIEALHDLTVDHNLLTQLRKKWIPCSELLGSESENQSKIAYKVVLSTLDAQRDRPENNFHDALNAQYALKIFNTRGTLQGKRVVPTLISGTEQIATLNLSRWIRASRTEVKPTIFASLFYLRITHSLFGSCPGTNRQVSELAIDLFKRSFALLEQYRETLTTIKRRCPDVDDASIYADSLSQDCIAALWNAKGQFCRDYSHLLLSNAQRSQSDKVSMMNQILTSRVQSQLSSGRPFWIKKALAEIADKVGLEDGNGELQFWMGTCGSLTLNRDMTSVSELDALIETSLAFSAPRSLEDMRPGLSFSDIGDNDWLEKPVVYMTAHPRYVGAYAVLRVEAQRLTVENRRLRLTWSHCEDCHTIWTTCANIAALLPKTHANQVKVEVIGSLRSQFRRCVSIVDLPMVIDDVLKCLDGAVSARMFSDAWEVHVDFEPFDGSERQVVITLCEMYEIAIVPDLSRLISDVIRPCIPGPILSLLLLQFREELLRLRF